MQKMKNIHKPNNKGFSLVELIIVISIIAILIGIMVPQLIKYIYKAKKSADIQTADAIGSVFSELMYDVTDPGGRALYDYISQSSGYYKKYNSPYNTPEKRLRVIAMLSSGQGKNPRHKLQITGSLGYKNYKDKSLVDEFLLDACDHIQDLQFTKESSMDCFCICCDGDMNIYVTVGGGVNYETDHIDSVGEGVYKDPGKGNYYQYLVYPTVSPEYLKLATPNDAKHP